MAWLALPCALAGACREPLPPQGGQAEAGYAAVGEILPARAEVVAIADELAVAGSRKGGEQGARLSRRAADLRRRLWRLERREADALEAVELYRAAAHDQWPQACEAVIDRVLLEGELRNDPVQVYRDLYLVRKKSSEPGCKARVDTALATLAAWKPLPNVLAELDREAELERDASVSDSVAPAVTRIDPSGPVIVPTLSPSAAREPVRISGIERYGAKDAARIVIFITQPTLFDVGFLGGAIDRGPRLYVDIDKASYNGAHTFEVGGIVQRVRVGARNGGTRVVLDLGMNAYRKVFYLPEPFRLVIDVSKEPPADLGATGGPMAVRRVVLDPGHGGHDPGAIGAGGLREKDVTLDIAHRAAPLIARELGIVTLLTRDSDDYVPLDERAQRANAFQADLFVSIHCNASEDGGGRGVMTFVLDESRDVLSSRIAARENAASAAAATELANAMSRVLDVGSRARSLHFADLLQRATMASLAEHYPDVVDQGIRRAGFYVLAGARMPAVLFETSFISSAVGEMRLNTGDYRQRMADGIVNAVRAYRAGK